VEDFLAAYGSVLTFIGINAILALSMYVTLACGQLSLANAAFMGIGAYTAALVTVRLDAPFGLALLMTTAVVHKLLSPYSQPIYVMGMLLANLVFGWITIEILRSVTRKQRVITEPAPAGGAAHD
jgi:branched-chain amino acid transport system permease protein